MGKKKYVYVSVAILIAAALAVILVANISEKQSDSDAVEMLQQRSAALAQRTLQSRPRPVAPPAPADKPETEQEEPAYQDTVALFEQLTEQMNAAKDDPEWKKAFDLIHRDQSLWDWELITAYLDAHQELIHAFRELLESGGALFEMNYVEGFAMDLPSLIDLRRVSGLLLADATLASMRDDEATVLENYTAFFRLTDTMKKEPLLILQMMHNGILNMFYEHVTQTMRGNDISVDALQKIVYEVSTTINREELVDALTFEGHWGLEVFDSIRKGDISSTGVRAEGAESFLWRVYGSAVARPFLNMDETAYARTMNSVTDAMALPFYEAEPLLEQALRELDALPQTRVMTNMMTPGFFRMAHVQARKEAQMSLLQLGLAVEHHYGEHGAYPETLEQVAPILGGAIPLDPYTGQPFVYQPRRGGFTLYSDCKDGHIVWRGTP